MAPPNAQMSSKKIRRNDSNATAFKVNKKRKRQLVHLVTTYWSTQKYDMEVNKDGKVIHEAARNVALRENHSPKTYNTLRERAEKEWAQSRSGTRKTKARTSSKRVRDTAKDMDFDSDGDAVVDSLYSDSESSDTGDFASDSVNSNTTDVKYNDKNDDFDADGSNADGSNSDSSDSEDEVVEWGNDYGVRAVLVPDRNGTIIEQDDEFVEESGLHKYVQYATLNHLPLVQGRRC